MKPSRLIFLSMLCTTAVAFQVARGQSFWLHVQHPGAGSLGGEAQLAAVDSSDCMLAQGQPDFEMLTRNYWNTWHYVITDSPQYNMRKHGTFAGAVHPSHNLILVGYNDYKVGHIVRSTDGGVTWKDSTIGSYTGGPSNSVAAMAALDSSHIAHSLIPMEITSATTSYLLVTGAECGIPFPLRISAFHQRRPAILRIRWWLMFLPIHF